MNFYASLLALCQDLEVDMSQPKAIFRKEDQEKIFGKNIKAKDFLFGEDGDEIDKMSTIVNSLYLQADNFQPSGGESGYYESIKMDIVKNIASVYEGLISFLLNKEINPETGYIIYKGKIYKYPEEEAFFEGFRKNIKLIREKHKCMKG